MGEAYQLHHDSLDAIAHDLRLPLSHIKGFASALRRTDVEWDKATLSDFLAEIELEADRLGELVESLLQTRRRDAAGAQRKNVEFAHPACVVDGAIDRVRGSLGTRVVRRNISANLTEVRMDPRQMERVLANLIQNAIKYSPSDSPIDLAARITSDNQLEFVVADRGPGVPVIHRARIFQPFFRMAAAHKSELPGQGLGLSICQSIVLAHSGRIEVTDRSGGGALFRVFLPLHTSRERDHDTTNHAHRGRRGSHVQASRRHFAERLPRAGCGRWLGSVEADRGAPVRP